MKELLKTKKIIFILALILISGIALQLSRSSFVLKSVENELDLTVNAHLLHKSTSRSQSVSDAAYCILYNAEHEKLKNNIEQTLHYMQKSYKSYDAALGKIELSRCPNVLLATAYLDDIGTVEQIEGYVKNGGTIFAMTTLEPTSLFITVSPHLGIISYSDFTTTTGIEVTSNFLIGAKGQFFSTKT